MKSLTQPETAAARQKSGHNRHLAAIATVEPVQDKHGYWRLCVSTRDGGGYESHVGAGEFARLSARAQAASLLRRARRALKEEAR